MLFIDYKTFIEQEPDGMWIYGRRYKKPWWKFWAEDRRIYYPAQTREDAEEGLRELENLYERLGVFQK